MKPLVIAIDGPAASGKSTTARLVAGALGYLHIDTGAMYRAVTLGIMRAGVDPSDEESVVRAAKTFSIRLQPTPEGLRVQLNGEDVTGAVRRPDVTHNVSKISSYPGVREVMVREQRRVAASGGVVLEGRDIGTVVLPDADVKVFMVARVQERARRRGLELASTGVTTDEDELVREIEERDRLDSSRAVSPLKKAPDAVELDTSDLTIEQQVETIVRRARMVQEGRA